MSEERTLTKEEINAINSLKRLAKRWPKTLALFGWSGTLCIIPINATTDTMGEFYKSIIEIIGGIHCDGGDPC